VSSPITAIAPSRVPRGLAALPRAGALSDAPRRDREKPRPKVDVKFARCG